MRRYFYLLVLLITVSCSESTFTVTPADLREPTRDELRHAMKYHGILFAQQDEEGDWYFLRDGKRCCLFAYVQNPEN